ncbi:MAG TPA: endonuclease/exonuclease/phosphatase family protein [Candidatus Saccharimonadia bacterium]|nr:endonuclease/exonuclease/phosphatase family protein [Candidatus Saccharimonadia bacterium]
MRLAALNVMSGGFPGYVQDLEAPARLPLLQTAVARLQADVVGLVDTFRWDALYKPEQLAQLFGYKSAYCINLGDRRLMDLGHNNGLTLLSNYEVASVETIWLGSRNALMAVIRNGQRLRRIFVLYLDDLSEDVRVQQTEAWLERLDPDEAVVALGDFNALDPADQPLEQPAFAAFRAANPELAQRLQSQLTDALRGEVTQRLMGRGLRDAAGLQRQPTFPTPLFPAAISGPFLRLDQAWHSPNVVVKRFTVLYDPIFAQASDHWPIVLDIE